MDSVPTYKKSNNTYLVNLIFIQYYNKLHTPHIQNLYNYYRPAT